MQIAWMSSHRIIKHTDLRRIWEPKFLSCTRKVELTLHNRLFLPHHTVCNSRIEYNPRNRVLETILIESLGVELDFTLFGDHCKDEFDFALVCEKVNCFRDLGNFLAFNRAEWDLIDRVPIENNVLGETSIHSFEM